MIHKGARAVAQALSWVLAAVGIAVLFTALITVTGVANYAIVMSGSMQPGIRPGDLIIELKADTRALGVGDVVSIHSPITHDLVTHRIVKIRQISDGEFHLKLKGDANNGADGESYIAPEKVWTPIAVIPRLGGVLYHISQPGNSIPLAFAFLGLIILIYLCCPKDITRRPTAR